VADERPEWWTEEDEADLQRYAEDVNRRIDAPSRLRQMFTIEDLPPAPCKHGWSECLLCSGESGLTGVFYQTGSDATITGMEPPLVHFRRPADDSPVCGADLSKRVRTTDPGEVTCEACRELLALFGALQGELDMDKEP
jgi:hypothetical protein